MSGPRLLPTKRRTTGLERDTKAGISHARARFELALCIVRNHYRLSPKIEREAELIACRLDTYPSLSELIRARIDR
jgi:hypothetical protein